MSGSAGLAKGAEETGGAPLARGRQRLSRADLMAGGPIGEPEGATPPGLRSEGVCD
jgi:hypothetical protein